MIEMNALEKDVSSGTVNDDTEVVCVVLVGMDEVS